MLGRYTYFKTVYFHDSSFTLFIKENQPPLMNVLLRLLAKPNFSFVHNQHHEALFSTDQVIHENMGLIPLSRM